MSQTEFKAEYKPKEDTPGRPILLGRTHFRARLSVGDANRLIRQLQQAVNLAGEHEPSVLNELTSGCNFAGYEVKNTPGDGWIINKVDGPQNFLGNYTTMHSAMLHVNCWIASISLVTSVLPSMIR